MKWLGLVLVYGVVAVGMFVFHHAWGALLGFHAAMLIILFIDKPGLPIQILLKGQHMRWVWWSVLLCGSSGLSLYLNWERFGITSALREQLQSLGLSDQNWPAFIVYFVLVNPLLEEYFWRGYLGSLSSRFDPSDFFYAGYHGLLLIGRVHPLGILFTLGALVLAGWLWRQIHRLDGGLRAPVLGHMAADLTILLAVHLRVA